MAKKVSVFFITSIILLTSYVFPAWSFDLTILHTNDMHAHLGGIKEKTEKPCFTSNTSNCVGGVARLAQAILDIRQTVPNSILLDAGDHFVGTAFYSDFLDTPDQFPFIEFVNRLGYVATAPGNHEFDNGCDVFFSAIRKLNFPVIASNLTFTDPNMQSAILPWTIVEREGKQIGIIGLALESTATTSNVCSEAVFSDAETALRKAIKELQKQNVFTIIVLSHLGTNIDIEMASKVEGVSVIVGGHTHTLLSNTHPGALGPYPVVKNSPSGHPVLVVTAKEKCIYLGRLDVTFNEKGIPQKWKGNPILLNEPLTNDPAITSIAGLLDTYGRPIQEKLEAKIGEIADPRNPSFDTSQYSDNVVDDNPSFYARKQEGLTANIILDAVLEAGKNYDAQVAILGTGLIRGSLPVGIVSKLDISTIIPIEDKLYVGELSGENLQAAVEHGASQVHFITYMGKFLQVSALRVTLDPSKEPGQRVQSIEIRNDDGLYEPLDPNKKYRVITNSFIAQGNDGFTMLKDVQWLDTEQTLPEVVTQYIQNHSPVQVKKDGRITNIVPPPHAM